ncbi:hypothetical protein KPH14_005585 [Odynerus spinipes]|uniref:Uncharacterized protein n=1 Tax=Odynerus spinipes TaxID=1348599 RepID=A0AAD9RBX8_9HYME|nr:hypothetical protein KPH14_005585 [Odynerus spinipes]
MDFKPCSTSKDAKRKTSKKKECSKKKTQIYNVEDEFNDPRCSIIYSNAFDEDDQMVEEYGAYMGCCTPKMTENVDWIKSESSAHTFPEQEKQNQCDSTDSIERTFNFRDDKLKESLPDIPSMPEYGLSETVELKPEPEVLATALLMSESEDLASTKPYEIFDKLFPDSSPKRTIPSTTPKATNDKKTSSSPVAHSTMIENEDTLKTIAEDTTDEKDIDESQISEIKKVEEELNPDDTTGDVDVSTAQAETTREEWTAEDDTLNYAMREDATPAYRNYVRLNGSVKPSWFAGYALVSSLLPNSIGITSDPGEPLLEAWRLCRPRHFDECCK